MLGGRTPNAGDQNDEVINKRRIYSQLDLFSFCENITLINAAEFGRRLLYAPFVNTDH